MLPPDDTYKSKGERERDSQVTTVSCVCVKCVDASVRRHGQHLSGGKKGWEGSDSLTLRDSSEQNCRFVRLFFHALLSRTL